MSAASVGIHKTPTTANKQAALHRYNYVEFIERFGWVTPAEYKALPLDLKQDIFTIVSIREARRNRK